jgi:hypothetical protein
MQEGVTCSMSTSCSMYEDTCSLTAASGNQLECVAPFMMLRTVCSSDLYTNRSNFSCTKTRRFFHTLEGQPPERKPGRVKRKLRASEGKPGRRHASEAVQIGKLVKENASDVLQKEKLVGTRRVTPFQMERLVKVQFSYLN